MKQVLKVLVSFCCWTILIIIPVFIWQKFWIFEKLELPNQILLTFVDGILVIKLLIVYMLPNRTEMILKEMKEHPFTTIQNMLYHLDNEEDIVKLRAIRRRVNKKIQSSKTNKFMIQATKDICGKNCKCKKLRYSDGCDFCEVYNGYVKYLQEYTKEE